MFQWVNSSGSLAGKVTKMFCYFVFVIVFSGCTNGCRLFSRPTEMYGLCFLSVDNDDALSVTGNKSKFNIDGIAKRVCPLNKKSEDMGYDFSEVFPFKNDLLVYISVILKNNEYPEDLDDMFIIENKTDKPQRCFAIINRGYKPGSEYKKGQKYILDGIDISLSDFESKLKAIKEMEDKGNKDYTVEDYWVEVNKKNPKIAFVVPPKAKILMKW